MHATAPLILFALLGGSPALTAASPGVVPVAFRGPVADTIPRRPIPTSEIELVGPVRPGEYLGVVGSTR
jgi:hypothetical protein